MIKKNVDFSIVAAQLTSWTLLVISSDMARLLATPYLVATMTAGVIFVVTSAVQLGRSYSSSTRPQPKGKFVDGGIYRFIRHPIYTGLLLTGLPFLLSRPTFPLVLTYLLIILVTNTRAGLEEAMLEERYPEYADYLRRTKRFVPFLV